MHLFNVILYFFFLLSNVLHSFAFEMFCLKNYSRWVITITSLDRLIVSYVLWTVTMRAGAWQGLVKTSEIGLDLV